MHDRLLRPAMVGVSKKSKKDSEVETNADSVINEEDNLKDSKNSNN